VLFFRRKEIIFRHFVKLPVFYIINRYWTTFETLAEIDRDCKERQLNAAWEIGMNLVIGK